MLDASQNAEFVRLWTLHGRRIYAYLLTLTTNRADADELYQDAGVTLWERFEQFEPGTSFVAWARSVVLNKVRNFRRLRWHQTVLCSPEFLDAVDQTITDRATTLDAQGMALADCFERLPPRQKELIDLRYRFHATPQEIATQAGRSLAAIYKALGRIHNSLLNCIERATLGREAP